MLWGVYKYGFGNYQIIKDDHRFSWYEVDKPWPLPERITKRLKKLLEPHRNGACPVEIQYSNGDAKVELRLGDDWRVKLDDALMTSLNEWLKPENVQVNYG